jgi:hypothetical protein
VPVSLDTLLGDWQKLLTDWADSRDLSRAACEALLLKGEPEPLKRLVDQWSHGDFSGLPPIVLLPASSIPGAAGVYAISTGMIYLNRDWLATASAAQAIAVLTEELGHWLDSQLSPTDTPGDEGARLARLLLGPELSPEEERSLRAEDDRIQITLASGQVLLAEASADTLAPTIQGLDLGATTLDPSQPGGAYLSAALRFSDNFSGFSSGSLRFRSSSSGQFRSLSFNSFTNNLQGSTLTGTLNVSQKLDPFTAAGSWVLDSISLYDKAGNNLNKSSGNSDWNTFLSASGITQTSFQVTYGPNPAPGTGPDSLAPTIQGLTLGATTLDPSQPGGAYLSAALRFSDNLSGFSSGSLLFRSSFSGQFQSLSFNSFTSNLQGSTLTGTLNVSRNLDPSFTAAGSWVLDSISLYDKAGNNLNKSSRNSDWNTFLSASGITQTSFQVAYGPNPAPGTVPDSLAPTIQGLTLGATTLDPSQPGGAYLSAALRFSDTLSGISSGSLLFRSSSSGQFQSLFFNSFTSNLQGSTLTGTLNLSRKLDPFTAAGSWVLDSISLYDKAGNNLNKSSGNSDWNTFLSASGITQTSFQVAYGSNPAPGTGPDSLAPTIQGLTLDSLSLDPSQAGGAFLSGRLNFKDNLSGYRSGSLTFSSDSGQSTSLSFNIISGSQLSGVAFASSQLNANAAAGTWRLTSVSLSDNANNSLYKSSSFSSDWNTFLSSSGITQTSFNVAYGPNPAPGTGPDSLAPTIQGLILDSLSLDPSQVGGAFLSGRLNFKDNLSGYRSGSLLFSSDSGQSTNLFFSSNNIISGSQLSGVAFASSQLNANAEAGTWRLTGVSLSDNLSNSLYKTSSSSSDWNTFLSSSGITQTSFNVAYGPNPAPGTGRDSLAPTIQGLTLDSIRLDPSQTGGAFLSGRLSFKDNVSGFKYGSFYFTSDSGQSTSLDFSSNNIISGSQLNGVAFASSQLNANAEAGTWRLNHVFLSDDANNNLNKNIIYSSDWTTFLSSTGITQTSFDVVYAAPPTTPVISLAVSPASVVEDGTANLVYTFTRTGSTTSPLTVNYGITGTADATDYSGAAPGTSKAISFTAGSATATLIIDPTVDTSIEVDETVALTLATGTAYTVGTTTAVVGTILNDDTVIENQGNTKLLKRGDGKAFVEVGGARQEITSPWGSPAGNDSSEWQMTAADTIGGVNQILWRNNTSSFLHLWNLDANWNWQSSSGADAFNSSRASELETSFQVDATRDGIIGSPFTTIEAQGNSKLLKRGDGKAFVEVGGARQEITSPWGSPAGNDSSEWQMMAADTISGINQILWRNNTSSFLHLWNLDANWNWQSSSGSDAFNSSKAKDLETIFQVDATRDGLIGAPFTTIEAQGNTKLLKRGDGKAFVEVGGARQEITSPWGSPAGDNTSEWQMMAADTISGVNTILWRNNTSSFLHLWSLDANWNWQSSSGSDAFNSPRASELETSFQVDATRDGIIGSLFTTIEARGNTKLLKRGDGKAFVEVGGARQEITSPWGSPAGDYTSEWQMMAADTISGVNQILWRNNTSSFLHLWSLDANWNWQSSSGSDPFNSQRAWELENSFQVDATRDGLIGAP